MHMNNYLPEITGTITKEQLDALPLTQFEGEIILADTARSAARACRLLRFSPVLGFDTETKPTFRKGDHHQVALLQLATEDCVVLIRLIKTGLIPEILALLSDPAILKTGVAIHDDIKGLQKMAPFIPRGFVEIQEMAKNAGLRELSLKKLCALTLGFRISKSQQLSNWESDFLNSQQLTYAATDAWASLKLYQQFLLLREKG